MVNPLGRGCFDTYAGVTFLFGVSPFVVTNNTSTVLFIACSRTPRDNLMSSNCACNQTPCTCGAIYPPGYLPECAPKPTKCDRYVPGTPNIWVERGGLPEDQACPGVCLLDTLSTADVINTLQRSVQAAKDMEAATSDPLLLRLARTVQRLPEVQEDDKIQSNVNNNKAQGSLPYYAIFRGNPPFAQLGPFLDTEAIPSCTRRDTTTRQQSPPSQPQRHRPGGSN